MTTIHQYYYWIPIYNIMFCRYRHPDITLLFDIIVKKPTISLFFNISFAFINVNNEIYIFFSIIDLLQI